EDFNLGFYEPVLKGTVNSKLPYGENNGAAWYGRGLNLEFQGGFHITSNFLDVSFRPHIIYQQNRDFEVPNFIPRDRQGNIIYAAQGTLPEDSLAQRIDRPFRFGPDAFTTFSWGHSSIRFHHYDIELGLSSEPLWWGPAVQYALVMSNNAAGVPHAFLGTRKPLQLPWNIGKVQFRWIVGWPRDSDYFSYLPRYHKKERFMNGLNIVYSPSFLPNLHIGTSRIIQQYIPKGGLGFSDYSGIFRPFPEPDKEALKRARDASHYEDKNGLKSVYFRWVLPESNAEIYGEYYKEEKNWNFRDFLMEPQHGGGYTFGVQKIFESNWIDFVKVNAEINSLVPRRLDDIRPQTYYYTHKTVKQGHTNRGQILGAAIGPGSESQFFGIDGFFKNGKLGFFAQRVVENDHLHYEFMQRYFPGGGFKDQFHHRVNLNLGVNGAYQFDSILLTGRVVWNKNFNYGRFDLGKPAFYTITGHNVVNMQYQLSVRYLF
ncbi:MAG TPA: capsule assembly Wzi family protein, partial [Fodinibius sp.]|nr:capsule assembly Wzi family protein [Fodinibius sp.]